MLSIKIRNKDFLKCSEIQFLKMYNHAKKDEAIISIYNASIRVFRENNTELFYSSVTTAIKDLINDGYTF